MRRPAGVDLTPEQLQMLVAGRGTRSQAELAAEIGVSQPLLAMYEKGTKRPPKDTLVRWAESVGYRVRFAEVTLEPITKKRPRPPKP